MSLPWRPLSLPASSRLPALIVSAQIGAASYTVRISDMANVWVESLDRKAICMRAWAENTTIDPSDTLENMAKFLATLSSALDPLHPSHGETSLGLAAAATDDAGDGGLTLRVTCALPGFAPLKWPLHLSKSPPSAVATHLVPPLLEAQCARKREVESLLHVIGQKDSVLNKLSDKLEAMGVGLEHVFTALSGRKRVTRLAADDKVRGLAPFDRPKWEADMCHGTDGPNNTRLLVQSIFGDAGLCYVGTTETRETPVLDRWWHDSGPTTQSAAREPARLTTPPSQTRPPNADPDQDGEFQVQATPPRLRTKAGQQGQEAAGEAPATHQTSSTADDGDEPLIPDSNPSPEFSASTGHTAPRKTPSVLGSRGGEKTSVQPRPESADQAGPKQLLDDSETASEDSDDGAATASDPASPSSRSPAETGLATPRAGLGSIGRGSPRKACLGDEKPPKVDAEDAVPPRKKLGLIGNKIGRGAPSPMSAQETERARVSAQADEDALAKSVARESSLERADRKREELKRSLEKKAAASPARKKRRF